MASLMPGASAGTARSLSPCDLSFSDRLDRASSYGGREVPNDESLIPMHCTFQISTCVILPVGQRKLHCHGQIHEVEK